MSQKSYSDIIRKWSRLLHRDLSFFFAGILMIYAISGFMLNHKKDFNSDYLIRQKQIRFTEPIPANPQEINREFAERLLKTIGEENRYLKHYSPEPGCIKIFIKGGSSLVIHTKAEKGSTSQSKNGRLSAGLIAFIIIRLVGGLYFQIFSFCLY